MLIDAVDGATDEIAVPLMDGAEDGISVGSLLVVTFVATVGTLEPDSTVEGVTVGLWVGSKEREGPFDGTFDEVFAGAAE